MTGPLRVTRADGDLVVGTPPEHPERTALLEARGAVLAWDVLSDNALPSARIHHAGLAAEWLWEIYGVDAAAVILDRREPAEVEVRPTGGDQRVRDTASTLAHLEWARAWWPASVVAGVPALDPRLLRAEQAVAMGALDHLLDHGAADAVQRAVVAAADAVGTLAALADDPVLGERATDLAAQLTALADDHGVALPEPTPAAPTRAGLALAAGGGPANAGEIVVLRGTSPVDWALVPQGTVDAAADAAWTVLRRAGTSVLDVAVPRAPNPNPTRLTARFGPIELPLNLVAGNGNATGRTPLPDDVLLLPAARRVLTVYAPDFATPDERPRPDPAAAARRAAIIALALARVGAPDATFAEHAAGVGP